MYLIDYCATILAPQILAFAAAATIAAASLAATSSATSRFLIFATTGNIDCRITVLALISAEEIRCGALTG